MEMHQRLHILRNYETYCYRVCYFLLQNEALATETAQLVLMDVCSDANFFQRSMSEKEKIVYKLAVKKSLQTYYESKVCSNSGLRGTS